MAWSSHDSRPAETRRRGPVRVDRDCQPSELFDHGQVSVIADRSRAMVRTWFQTEDFSEDDLYPMIAFYTPF